MRTKTLSNKALFALLSSRLDAFVKEHDLNRSAVRGKILETIVFEARHFTAPDLVNRLKKRHPGVGKATLYRALPVLIQSGILREGPSDASGQVLYELSVSDEEHHDHIVCIDCHSIYEFHDDVIEERQNAILKKLGFEGKSHQHVIYASCGCKKR